MDTITMLCIECGLIACAIIAFMVYKKRSSQKRSLTFIGAAFDMLVLGSIFFPLFYCVLNAYWNHSISQTGGIVLLTIIAAIASVCLGRDIMYLIKAYRINKHNRTQNKNSKFR